MVDFSPVQIALMRSGSAITPWDNDPGLGGYLAEAQQQAAQQRYYDAQTRMQQYELGQSERVREMMKGVDTSNPEAVKMLALQLMKVEPELGARILNSLQGAEAPSSVREYEYFNSLGEDEKRQYLQMKRANPFVDIGGEVMRPDPITGQPTVNIPKVPTIPEQNKLKKTAAAEKKLGSYQISENQTTIDKIDELLSNKKGLEAITGLSSSLPNVSEAARNAQADLDTLKSRSAFAGLQEMRANSPTGGALGGIAVQELEMLKSAEASLQEAQSPEEFKKALRNYRSALALANKTVRESYQSVYGEDLPAADVIEDGAVKSDKYKVGDIIEAGGKKYRVIGGDMNDPDVEAAE